MQGDVQAALATKLMADPTLMGLLAQGTASVKSEGDSNPDTPVPFIVLEYAGNRIITNTHQAMRETWTIRVYDKGNGYFNIEKILDRVFVLLNNQTIILPPTASVYALQNGIRFQGMTTRNYNESFMAQFEGAVFDVYLFDKMSDA